MKPEDDCAVDALLIDLVAKQHDDDEGDAAVIMAAIGMTTAALRRIFLTIVMVKQLSLPQLFFLLLL
eukprot:6815670-Ditylum_brightwellii.AAC.1